LSDDTLRLSMIGQIIRRRWRLLVVFAALGALVGAGVSLVYPPRYEATSSVLLHGPREPDELATEAQIAVSSVVLDRTAAATGWGVSATKLRDVVSAKVLDGNVIEIKAAATTPERAQQLADSTVQEYTAYSAQLASNMAESSAQVQVVRERQDELRRQIEATNQYIASLRDAPRKTGAAANSQNEQTITELEKLRGVLDKAVKDLEAAEAASGRANLAVIGRAERPSSPKPPTRVHLILGGALLFLLLGVVGHLIAARSDRRLRAESDIAAALASPIIASVDVPDGRRGRRGRLRRLVRDDQAWNVPVPQVSDELSLDARYHRVLNRLRGLSDAALRVLVASDDAIARRAAERLAAMADAADGPGGPGGPRLELEVVDVRAGRPAVAGGDGGSGAVVVLTLGTRTPWELVGIAEACADAGHEVLGAVVTYRTPRRLAGAAAPVASPEIAADRDAMAGSA
jgi:capsular polysaccharide biosynthesis protein